MPTAINPPSPSFQNSLEIESHPHSFSSTAAFIGKFLFGAGSAVAISGAAVMAYSQVSSANRRGDFHSATANLIGAETALREMLATCVKLGARLWRNQCVTPEDTQFGRVLDCPLVQANFNEAQLDRSHGPDTCGKTICDESDAFCGGLNNGLNLDMAYHELNAAKEQVQSATEKSSANSSASFVAAALLGAGSAVMITGAVINRIAVRHQANRMAHEPTGQQV